MCIEEYTQVRGVFAFDNDFDYMFRPSIQQKPRLLFSQPKSQPFPIPT